jgi:hypothetical protein
MRCFKWCPLMWRTKNTMTASAFAVVSVCELLGCLSVMLWVLGGWNRPPDSTVMSIWHRRDERGCFVRTHRSHSCISRATMGDKCQQLIYSSDMCNKYRNFSLSLQLRLHCSSASLLHGLFRDIVTIYFLVSWGGVRLSPLGMSATNWPIVPVPVDRWWMWSSGWNKNLQGKPKYSEKTCPSATLSTTNPTWPDLGSNPDRRVGKPATNCLSYGTASTLQVAQTVSFQSSDSQWIMCLKWIERNGSYINLR